jgi:hypothetical protein
VKGTHDFSGSLRLEQQTPWEESENGSTPPEEQARITDLQDALIGRFFANKEAVAGQESRVKELQAEIDDLLREKEEIVKCAAVGSA